MTLSPFDIADMMEESELPPDQEGESSLMDDEDEEQAPRDKRPVTIDLSSVALSDLPPLPTEHYTKQRQRNGGVSVVLFSIFAFVGTTHGLGLELFPGFERNSAPWWTFFILIYIQAALAILGLIAMIVADPGVVQRSKESCYPIPVQMGPALQDYLDQRGKFVKHIVLPREKYLMAEDGTGDSYCVRCMVWRRAVDGKHYHCNTCQQCVKQYDHHCGVFGRCIAGKMFSAKGNYKYFVLMGSLFVTAFWTSFVAITWSLSNVYGPTWVVPIACLVVLYLMVSTRLLIMGPRAICGACRR